MKRREVILVLLVGVGRVFGTDRAAARLLAQPCKVVRIRILGGLGRRRSTRSSATGGGHRRGCCPGRGRSTRSSASGDSHGCAIDRIARSITSGDGGGYSGGRNTRSSATGGGHRRGYCPGRGRSTRSSASGDSHGCAIDRITRSITSGDGGGYSGGRNTRSSATCGGHRRGCCPGRGRSTRSSATGGGHGCGSGRSCGTCWRGGGTGLPAMAVARWRRVSRVRHGLLAEH